MIARPPPGILPHPLTASSKGRWEMRHRIEFFRGVAGHALRHQIDPLQAAFWIYPIFPGRGVVGDDAETFFAFLQGDFGMQPLADVVESYDRAFDHPFADNRRCREGNREKAAFSMHEIVEIDLTGFPHVDSLVNNA